MRLPLALLPAFFLLAPAALVVLPNQESQSTLLKPLGNPSKVPGKNPVEYCSPEPDTIVSIKYIDLDPNPPLAGRNLTIDAQGYVSGRIEEGAYATYEVKYGVIKLLTGTADLCEKAAEVDVTCPIEGKVQMEKVVQLPSQIPPVLLPLFFTHIPLSSLISFAFFWRLTLV